MALLIANSAYGEYSPSLSDSEKEVKNFADELKRDGFNVEIGSNLSKQDMKTVIDRFKARVKDGDTALFFFSGVGLQYNRQTYLIPVNAEIWKEADIKRDGVKLDTLLSDLSSAGASVKIVILDAAHSNPFERNFRDVPSGLTALETPPGSLILLSASPGKFVPDKGAELGLFMGELLRQIRQPGSAESAFTRTRVAVANKSRNEQVPWVSSSLTSEFSFFQSGRNASQNSTPIEKPRTKDNERSEGRRAEEPASRVNRPVYSESHTAGSQFRDCDNCPELIVVKGGKFTMGSKVGQFEAPAHVVKIDHPFAIGRYEVTIGEWQRCVDAGDCRYQLRDHGRDRSSYPVSGVSWEDANAYVKWLSRESGHTYRLPTEAEWEYSARGGTVTPFWWGRDKGDGNANCSDCGASSPGKPSEAGIFKPNGFGLYDTAGNVAEWVQDCWNESYNGAPADGSAWLSGKCAMRVLRGGYFGNKAQSIRSAARFRYQSDVRYMGNGFRVLRELPE